MNEKLHRHLDGDLSAGGLGPEERDEAGEWDRMLASFRSSAPRGSAPPWLEQRVMAEIDALPEPGLMARAAHWLLRPRPVRVSPLAAGFAAAAFALAVLLPRGEGTRDPDGMAGAGAARVVYVQFVLDAPAATSVAVAGDFTEWEPTFTLEDLDGDGVWTGRVPVEPGVHGYMFLIDGTRWETDPNADRYRDDGFGNRNAILAVASGA